MKIKKAYLERGVSLVSRLVTKGNPQELLRSVKLSVDGKFLSLSATGTDGAAYASIPITSGEDVFVVCINAELLKNVLSKIKDEFIDLTIVKDKLVIGRSGGSIKLSGANAVGYPPPLAPGSERASIELETQSLRDTVHALMCGSEEERVTTTPWQNVVKVRIAGPEFLAMSSDGNRMTLVDGKCEGTAGGVMQIPFRAIKSMYGILGEIAKGIETVRLTEDENYIWLWAGNNIAFAFRKLSVDFPDLDHILTQMEWKHAAQVDSDRFKAVLELVGAVAGDKPNVRTEISSKGMTVIAASPDRGSVSEGFEWQGSSGMDFVTGYNVQYILPALRQLSGEIAVQFAVVPAGQKTNYPFKLMGQIGDIRASYIVQSLQIYPGSK